MSNANSISAGGAENALYAHVVLDRSGSMEACAAETVAAYNTYVLGLPPTARVTLTLFDTEGIDVVFADRPPRAALLSPEQFIPRGGTPLYDAIGRSVSATDRAGGEFDRVALVILTDGLENASREFSATRVRALLEERQKERGWLVIYLGANQDAWAVGGALGVRAASSLSFDMERVGTTMSLASEATGAFLREASAEEGLRRAAFSAEARKRAKG